MIDLLLSLGLLLIVGYVLGEMVKKVRLPSLVGYLITGIVLGPYVLNLIDPTVLDISGELRNSALIIILIRAGLSLNIKDLKQVGRPALLLSLVPATLEIIGYAIFTPLLFNVNVMEALVIGAILAAVSPAVVVPRMVKLIDENYGTKKGIPQMLLAASSLDDVFVIVLFTTFLSLLQEGNVMVMDFVNIPVSILLGILLGAVVGWALAKLFNVYKEQGRSFSTIYQTMLVLSAAFILYGLESILSSVVAISGLIAVISMGIALMMFIESKNKEGRKISAAFDALWAPAQILLFALVGSAVDIRYTVSAGGAAILILFIGLAFRSIGVFVSMIGTHLNVKEKLFVFISYLPKATVQAAIGGVPLAAGLPVGPLALSISVIGILITAPLGAFLMDFTYEKLLRYDGK